MNRPRKSGELSRVHAESDGNPRCRRWWRNVGEIVGIIWRDADRFVRQRLAAVLLLVITASVLTALGPLALKWLVEFVFARSVFGNQ